LLALAGELPPWPRLAIVGSRAAHTEIRDAAAHAVEIAAELGWSVVSGGAIGIDRDAHAAALARGVPQLAVLPCGPDLLYPADNADLLRAIPRQRGSGLLFALAQGTALSKSVFASRNALVVALSDAVLIVEAQARSGSFLTGRLALRAGKRLATVAGSPGNAMLAATGARQLHFARATAQLFAAEVRAFLRDEPPPARPDAWPAHLRWLRDAIVSRGALGLSSAELAPQALLALVTAEAAGLVAEVSPGRWILT
jgi:DNA processing protein